jgi:alkylated DNA repair dioxygenase AlkB
MKRKAGYTIEKPERTLLNTEGTSWIERFQLERSLSKKELEELWSLHPEDFGEIMIMGKVVKTPRWQQSYGLPYSFSGLSHPALPFPPQIQKYLDYANSLDHYLVDYKAKFNMCLVNWYEGGEHYIGPHSDDERQLAKSPKGETVVFTISFGQERDFVLKPKKEGLEKKIPVKDGTVLIMGGLCQQTHKHSLPKRKKATGRRISLTFRIFVNK